MPIICVKPHSSLCPGGTTFEADVTLSICENLLKHGVAIEHACEMVCACTTCHLLVREGFDSLNPPTEREEDMLDLAWGLESSSRLSCQSFVNREDITVEIPRYSLNHAREEKK